MTRTYSFISKTLKGLKYILIAIFSAIILYFSLAFLFSVLPTHPPDNDCKKEATIYLNTNGVHVDFIIPAEYLGTQFKQEIELLPGTRFVAFGWGDRNFYIKTPQWSNLTFYVAFKALFMKSSTAMHVTFYPRQADNWNSLNMCHQQLQQLIVYIESTFFKDESGGFVKMDFEGYNDYDAFYEANGSFSLFNTCNVWVNKGLKKIEVKTAVWTPFDFGVLYHVK